MKTIRLVLLIPALGILLYSCQKEVDFQDQLNPGGGSGGGTTTNKSIIGDYDFVGISAFTRTTVLVTDPLGDLKTITTSNYVSTNNSGTAKFTTNQFEYTNIAYSISTTAHLQLFLGSALLNESDLPFDFPSVPVTGAESYTKNNNDSLTFDKPIFIASNPFSSTITPTPMGARISWSGDTLLLKIKHTVNGAISQGGVPATFTGFLDGVMKLKKK